MSALKLGVLDQGLERMNKFFYPGIFPHSNNPIGDWGSGWSCWFLLLIILCSVHCSVARPCCRLASGATRDEHRRILKKTFVIFCGHLIKIIGISDHSCKVFLCWDSIKKESMKVDKSQRRENGAQQSSPRPVWAGPTDDAIWEHCMDFELAAGTRASVS